MAKDFSGAVGGVLSRNNGHRASWTKATTVEEPVETVVEKHTDTPTGEHVDTQTEVQTDTPTDTYTDTETEGDSDTPTDQPVGEDSVTSKDKPHTIQAASIKMSAECWNWIENESLARIKAGKRATYTSVYTKPIEEFLDALEDGSASWQEVVDAQFGDVRETQHIYLKNETLIRLKVALAEKKMERTLPKKALNMSNFVIAACRRAMDKVE